MLVRPSNARMTWWLATVGAVVLASGCHLYKDEACATATCTDRTYVELSVPNNVWKSVAYTVDVVAYPRPDLAPGQYDPHSDGVAPITAGVTARGTCVFAVDAAAADAGAPTAMPASIPCGPVFVHVAPESNCTNQLVGSGSNASYVRNCVDVPGHFVVTVERADVAIQRLDLKVTRAGSTRGSGTVVPDRSVYQPNGPDCAPTCQIGRGSLTIVP